MVTHGLSFALPMVDSVAFFWHLALVLHYAASKHWSISNCGVVKDKFERTVFVEGETMCFLYMF